MPYMCSTHSSLSTFVLGADLCLHGPHNWHFQLHCKQLINMHGFPSQYRSKQSRLESGVRQGREIGQTCQGQDLLMRDGPLNNWMGWAVSTVEAEAFKALAIVKENPPSTLCSMAVIYARASKRVPYGSQRWMHKAMSGLAKHTLEAAAKRASHSYGWSNDSGGAIIQLCILSTETNDSEGSVEHLLCVPCGNMGK